MNRVGRVFLVLALAGGAVCGIGAGRAQASPLGWSCTLWLQAAQGRPNYCTLGAAASASDGEDPYDWPGFLPNPDALIAFEPIFDPGVRYWQDWRTSLVEGETKAWSRIVAHGQSPGPLTLSWSFLEPPEDFEFTLFFEGPVPDPTGGTPVPMDPGASFAWTQEQPGWDGRVFLRVEVTNPQRSGTLPDCAAWFDPPNPVACEPVTFALVDPDQDIGHIWWSYCEAATYRIDCRVCATAEQLEITRSLPQGTQTVFCAVANTIGDYTICQTAVTVANAPPTLEVGFGPLGRLSEPPMTWPGEPLVVRVRAEDRCCGRVEMVSIDWGDGSSQVVSTGGSHTYDSPGTYLVTVTAVDEQGAASVRSAQVTIHPQGAGCSVIVDPPAPWLGESFTLTAVPFAGEAIACEWARGVYGDPVEGCSQGPFVLHPFVRDHPERGWPILSYDWRDNSLHYSVRCLDSTGGLSECSGAISLPWRDVAIEEVRQIRLGRSDQQVLMVTLISRSEVTEQVRVTIEPAPAHGRAERLLRLDPGQRRTIVLRAPTGCATVEASLTDAYDLAPDDNYWRSPECGRRALRRPADTGFISAPAG